MHIARHPPESGQFVAIWVYPNKTRDIYSATFRYRNGTLEEFDSLNDKWLDAEEADSGGLPNETHLEKLIYIQV